MKILLIDDETEARSLARELFARKGISVVEASSGQQGLGLAGSEKPDLILLDLLMPRIDGLTTLAALHENPETAGIPIILWTGLGRFLDAERVHQLGVLGLVRKPIHPKTFVGQVLKILESHGQKAA